MKKLMMLVAAALMWSAALAGLPDGYVPVEYVESTGYQSISSFYTVTADTKVVMDFVPLQNSGDKYFFGTTTSGFAFNTRNKYTSFFYSGSTLDICPAVSGTEYVVTVGQGMATVTEKLSGKTTTAPYTGAPTGAMGLFDYNNGAYRSQMRLYGLKIYEGDTLTRDCVMCKNDSAIAGLYDLVTDTFYSNTYKGSKWKELVAGPEVIQTNALEVTTSYGGDPGTTPACGRVTDLAEGDAFACSAPQTFVDPYGSHANCACTGYRLYDCAIDPATGKMALTEVVGSPFSGTSFTYTHGTTMRRLVWQYSGTYLGTNVYVGASGRPWSDAANWSKGAVPDAADHVVIEGKTVYFAPTGASATLRSLTLKNGAILEVQAPAAANPKNFTTVYPSAFKLNVTETFTIERGGTFRPIVDKLSGNPVFVNAANFVLMDGGQVDATGTGYGWHSADGVVLADLTAQGHRYVTTCDAYTYGIGAGENPNGGTASYGTKGSRKTEYGSAYAPWLAGSPSGGNENIKFSPQKYARGGGAVVIFTSLKQTVAGDIWAEGESRTFGSGSGGGIWLVGNAFEVYSTARLFPTAAAAPRTSRAPVWADASRLARA